VIAQIADLEPENARLNSRAGDRVQLAQPLAERDASAIVNVFADNERHRSFVPYMIPMSTVPSRATATGLANSRPEADRKEKVPTQGV
jgi:hypothetical protein